MPSSQLLLVVLPVALPLLAPFLVALYQRLLENLPSAQRRAVERVVGSAVPAAEQIYANIPGAGPAKKLWVESQVKAILGTRINPALVNILVEEAVAMMNADKQTSAPVGFTPPTPAPLAAPQPVPSAL